MLKHIFEPKRQLQIIKIDGLNVLNFVSICKSLPSSLQEGGEGKASNTRDTHLCADQIPLGSLKPSMKGNHAIVICNVISLPNDNVGILL